MNLQQNLSRSREVLGAYLRQGAKELANAFYGSGTVAQHPELGMAFTKTPGEITAGMRGERSPGLVRDDPAPSPSVLDKYTQPAPEQEVTAPELDSHSPQQGSPQQQTPQQEAPEIERD